MRASGAGVVLCGAAVVVPISFANGGYFRESWVWLTLALCSLAGIVLLVRERIVVGRLELAVGAALAAFVAWTALSATWSSAPTRSLHDAERGLAYVAGLLAFLLLVERERVHELLRGVAAGITLVAGYSLGERLFATATIPTDPVSGTRLTEPLGYANALGVLVAMGVLLALGLAVHAVTRPERALWCAAPALLVSTLALTQSRGAIVAFAAGLGVLTVLETRRAELLAVALLLAAPCAAAVLLTLSTGALTDAHATTEQVSSAGRRLAFAVALLMLASGLVGLRSERLAARLGSRRSTWTVPAVLGLALASVVAVAVLGVDRALGPRVDYWRIAWHQFEQNPWLGSGANTFFQYWRNAGMPVLVLDAHSLYLETLAELGLIGLAFLTVALCLPLVATVREHGQPFAGVATSLYVVFLLHAGLDWDWEMPAVTVTGILGAVAVLVTARPDQSTPVGLLGRWLLATAVCLVAVLAVAMRLFVE